MLDHPEDAGDDLGGGYDDGEDWGERGSGVRGTVEILRVETSREGEGGMMRDDQGWSNNHALSISTHCQTLIEFHTF